MRLTILLPAAVLIACYSLVVNTGKQRDLQSAEAKLRTAQTSSTSPLDVLEQKARIAQATREIEQLSPRKDQLVSQAKLFCGAGEHSRDHVAAVECLTNLLTRHELRLLGESTVVSGSQSNQVKLPGSLDEATKKLAEHGGTPDVLLWKVEFTGRYGAVVRLLDDLGRDDSPIVAVSLSLAKAELGSTMRKWTLVLLIGAESGDRGEFTRWEVPASSQRVAGACV